MRLSEDSFAFMAALALTDPQTERFFDRSLAQTYEQFIDVLYRDIDRVLQKVQERKQIFCDKNEDEITMYICDLLDFVGYQCSHDTKMGGHIDIVIRGKQESFLWLGEAKRDNGPAWIGSGFEQLCSRYSTGGNNQQHGGILVYIQGKDAATIFNNWRNHLPTLTQYSDLQISECSRTPATAFVSTHLHETSGLPYEVRHMSVALFHSPTV